MLGSYRRVFTIHHESVSQWLLNRYLGVDGFQISSDSYFP